LAVRKLITLSGELLLFSKEENMKYDKPFLDYGKRIEKLKVDYNLEITNKRILEKEFLKTISYYDLINGYKDCFMINGKFQNENILTLFNFSYLDKRFQNETLSNFNSN